MINEHLEAIILNCDNTLTIPAEACATVQEENNLLHATLILSRLGHSEVPVLNKDMEATGVIGMPMILAGITNDAHYDWDKLGELKVKDVMKTDIGKVVVDCPLEDILHELVSHRFLAVADKDGKFTGIITRKEIFTRVNFLCHQIDKYCDVNPHDDMAERLQELS